MIGHIQLIGRLGVFLAIGLLVFRKRADYKFHKSIMVALASGLVALGVGHLLCGRLGWYTLLAAICSFLALDLLVSRDVFWRTWSIGVAGFALFCAVDFGFTELQSTLDADKAPKAFVVSVYEQLSGNEFPEGADPEKGNSLHAARRPATGGRGLLSLFPSEPDWHKAGGSIEIAGTARNGAGRVVVSVNGDLKEVGDTVSVRMKGWQYRWRIRQETSGRIALDGLDVRPSSS